ncbi:MAG: DUF3291 domain-containing protein [Flavobacterium sp.]|nr:DUF3291 domain-containing protein [Pedobacter sp.]
MLVAITIVNYRRRFIPFALMAMAVHRLPLMLSKRCLFWKLMGCGEKGTFTLKPDLRLWVTLTVWKNREDLDRFYAESFISKWWNKFALEKLTILSEPLSSHGQWSGKEPFKNNINKDNSAQKEPVLILTRATIRPGKVKSFWSNVNKVAVIMGSSKGFIYSVSCGEAPFYLQATLSIWESMDDAVNFAYKSPEHAEVIKKTRTENWYSEELFARFKPVASFGSLNGINPLSKYLINETEPANAG